MQLPTIIYLANAGIPLFTQSVFYQIILLIPIIAIEAYILRKILAINVFQASLVSSAVNIVSTLIGIIIFLAIGIGFASTFPQTVVQPGSFPHTPIDLIISLIPMYFVSVFFESLFGALRLKKISRRKVLRTFAIANAYTYLMLESLAISQLVKGYIERR
ncbi:hypothetical protein [Rivularia sp. UHCC 0363]|uniref:hypothetical protein n=1 Tax=Rivularia sp. UHCC 0363 TaxID=3110244 RepID=UPI002B1EA33C|nr:hypothetical protein [Rivularia sp. UHCC 0363]MEA5595466.1 hypothetical protein [Rivularia sp. UHCC 0363]